MSFACVHAYLIVVFVFVGFNLQARYSHRKQLPDEKARDLYMVHCSDIDVSGVSPFLHLL